MTLGIDSAREALRLCNSYDRIPTLLALWTGCAVEWNEWLELLGEEWSGSDNIGLHLDALFDTPLSDVLFGANERRFLLTPEESEAWERLPDRVTIYRGCYASNKWGLSWSLDRDLAAKFPTLHRYKQDGQPLLVKAVAEKTKIAAVKLDRGEAEIIAYRPRHISTSKL